MQKMTLNTQAIKILYYLAAIAFHWALFFTNTGNYFHGGTLIELIAMQAVAVLIAVAAIRLMPKVGTAEKIVVALCAVIPGISVVWSLITAIAR